MTTTCARVSSLMVMLLLAVSKIVGGGGAPDVSDGGGHALVPLVQDTIAELRRLHARLLPETLFAALEEIARRLPQRLAALSDRECLIAVAADGRVLGVRLGAHDGVVLGAAFDAPLQVAGAEILLIHNHPANTGLSAADLGQLDKPGVSVVVAVGRDGGVYSASRGERFRVRRLEQLLYPEVTDQVRTRMRIDDTVSSLGRVDADQLMAHFYSVALARAHVIVYRARLPAKLQAVVDSNRVLIGRATETAAARIRRME